MSDDDIRAYQERRDGSQRDSKAPENSGLTKDAVSDSLKGLGSSDYKISDRLKPRSPS